MRTVSSDHYLMTSVCMLPCCQLEEARELHLWGRRRDRAMRTVSNDHYLMTSVRVLSCCQMEETRELHLDVGEERQGNEDSQQ